MGFAKQKMIEDFENGFTSGNGKVVCTRHIEDYAVKNFIKMNGKKDICSYCYKVKKTVNFDLLLKFLLEHIKREYSPPADELPFESSEGGYQGYIIDKFDLLVAVLKVEDKLYEDLVDSITTDYWCKEDYFGTKESEDLLMSFKAFCKISETLPTNSPVTSNPDFNILEDILRLIKQFNLIQQVKNLVLKRGRVHELSCPLTCAEIGPAENNIANSNRFTLKGMSAFYGAQDSLTCVKEILHEPIEVQLSIGTFESLKSLNLLDLTNVPVISLFDEKKRDLYHASLFLNYFSKAISIPLYNKNAIGYKPTQVMTAFLRKNVQKEFNMPIDGIIYQSAANISGICYVLFIDNTSCSDEGNISDDTILILKNNSVRTTGTETLFTKTKYGTFEISDVHVKCFYT